MKLFSLLAAFVLSQLPLYAASGTTHPLSPEDATNIQRILDLAEPGDTVEFAPGLIPGPPETTNNSSVLLVQKDVS